jgi:hypothetical protein
LKLRSSVPITSVHLPGTRTLDVVFTLDAGRGRFWRAGHGQVGETWPLDEFPSSAQILDGGAFVARADDPEADPAERAVLEEFGLTAVLAAAATDDDGCAWLVEIYADGEFVALEAAHAATRLLVREAVTRRGHVRHAPAQAVA